MKNTYFITGGTGSFSKKFVELIVRKKIAKKIIIFSRDEYKQMLMKELPFVKQNEKIFRFYIGDVRDKDRLKWAINDDVDIVIHTAALKQVPTTEYNPFETVKTKVIAIVIMIALSTNTVTARAEQTPSTCLVIGFSLFIGSENILFIYYPPII